MTPPPDRALSSVRGRRRLAAALLMTATLMALGASPASAAPSASLDPVASGFSQPILVTHAGDGSGRLFVTELAGRIRIVRDGALVAAPFLDISTTGADRVLCCGEQGLLSVAFPPNYAAKRYFYVNYTRKPDGATVIARYSVPAGTPDTADSASEQVVLTIAQPYDNHNGGQSRGGDRSRVRFLRPCGVRS